MTYKLWIDDDAGKEGIADWRNPPAGEPDWKVAHSSDEATAIVINFGLPSFIDFDHDLGMDQFDEEDKVMRFLGWLSDTYPTGIDSIADYRIHSANLEGAKNIHSFMSSWRRSRALP